MSSKSLQVGITGGIGAGKSIVANIFSVLGVPIYDADTRAKFLMNRDEGLKANIVELLGPTAYQQDGMLNRTYVGGQVFGNPSLLEKLNAIVHPAVGKDFQQWAKVQSTPYVLKEAALLIENGTYQELDAVIVVAAPEDIRIQRVLDRDAHRTEEDVKNIIDRQLPQQEKTSRADFVVDNSGEVLVIPQVLEIHQQILDQIGR
ncbi:dephospho-CoA kinase [Marinoscillum furvescens]|uniref:Dephospho-CoA kinase n=1 Tax=Marinoscillum furvescens DSM 4134 TaxID=1122208 RepID=A0A3D9L4Z2_MARFU|nr:dephospho-CoA kinase [Marinoscillum furvescens]REE00589.1 dephospho-CoA kinase [Marinoscillum furvescens DSM 4134]